MPNSRAAITRGAWLLALVFAIWGAGMAPVSAQTGTAAAKTPVLLLDQDRLYRESSYGRAAAAEIRVLVLALQEKEAISKAELEAEEKELSEQRAVMDPEAFRAASDAFDKKVGEIRDAHRAAALDINAQSERFKFLFFRAAEPVLLKMLQERGATMVLDVRNALLAVPSSNITNEAILRVDQEIVTIPAAIPATTPQE